MSNAERQKRHREKQKALRNAVTPVTETVTPSEPQQGVKTINLDMYEVKKLWQSGEAMMQDRWPSKPLTELPLSKANQARGFDR